MPAYNPSILISDCYGSAGSITFYHRDGKCRWRRRSSLSFAGTPAQCAALSVHRRALAAWRTISDTEKERWHDIAKNVQPRRPPFGSGGHISGHNLFVSAYHGFVTLGDEHIPPPVEYRPFPAFAAEFVSAYVANSSGLRILLRLSMPQEREPERYALLCKVQLTEAGKGCNPGKMRNILAEETENETDADVGPASAAACDASNSDNTVNSRIIFLAIPDYRIFSGICADRYSLHIRYMLIDRLTGYRSQCQKLSTAIDIG